MGQKTNPIGFRLGTNRSWDSSWCTQPNQYATLLHEDVQIRTYIRNKLASARIDVGAIYISRTSHSIKIKITVGNEYADAQVLENALTQYLKKAIVLEITSSRGEAKLIAREICHLIERRTSLPQIKRVILQRLEGYKGAKLIIAGRFNGVTMARREVIQHGRVPLHTIRVRIDYGTATAYTVYGTFGVKVWLNIDKDEEYVVSKETKV